MIFFHPYEEFMGLQLSSKVNSISLLLKAFWGNFRDDHCSDSVLFYCLALEIMSSPVSVTSIVSFQQEF